MSLDPRARRLLERLAASGRPPADQLPLEEARRAYRELLASGGPAPAVAAVRDLWIPGPAAAIPARLVRPAGEGPPPLVVFFHGGGWALGDLDSHDRMARSLAVASRAAVLSVGYRLAPEHPFPAAFEDCLEATVWAAGRAAELGVQPGRLAVAGDSAGGNLAAAVALAARERGGPRLAFQLLVYPALDASCATASYASEGRGYRLTSELMAWYWTRYLGGGGRRDPRAEPALAGDLRGLAPALVVTAEHDPLRDEGEAYAGRLRDAGVPAAAVRYGGQVHGFFAAEAHSLGSAAAVALAGAAVRRRLS